MTAPDPTAGEGACDRGYCGQRAYCDEAGECLETGRERDQFARPAVAASTGTSEDVEALVDALEDADADIRNPYSTARGILASDWLAAREAAARAEERQRIAQAIEALPWSRDFEDVGEKCAQIAREGR